MRRVYRWIVIAFLAGMPLAASAQQAFTVRDTEVFAGPSGEFPPVGLLPPNVGVRIVGCLADWSWCDVIFSNYRGWVYAADLAVPYQGSRVVIIERGPQFGPQIGLTVVTFSLTTYWDRHYRGQPWYREREQWASRVHVEGSRGGPPPKGRAAQTERAQPPQGDRRPQAGPPGERSKGVPESGRTAPGAGGPPPKDEGARGGDTKPRPQAAPPGERSKGIPESGRPAPGAGAPPPAAAPRPPEGRPPREEGKRGPGERAKGIPEAGKSAPGAGGKPHEAGPRPGGAHPKDEGHRGGGPAARGKAEKKDGDAK